MAYLNWSDSKISQEIRAYGDSRSLMKLGINSLDANALIAALQEVTSEVELRIDLPQDWILFWKCREGGSRVMLAHPDANVWVATVALSQADFKN